METVRAALAGAAQRLARAGVDDAEREASWLLSHVLATSAGALRLRSAEPLSPEVSAEYAALVGRRAGREPLQYIFGTEEFMGMTFQVSPAVLIPRYDTETLVREAAALLHGPVRVADIGTGSGAIALGLAALLPEAAVIAVDISREALAVAAGNAKANGLEGRIDFRQGDLTTPLTGEQLDAVVSNPPYIPETEWTRLMPEVRDFEPRSALTPGTDGLLFYRRLAAETAAVLKAGGFLAVEVGYDQAQAVAGLFAESGFQVTVRQDTAAIDRVVIGRKA